MKKNIAIKKIAELYINFLEENLHRYPTKKDELSYSHLIWMCDEISKNYHIWPIDKSSRWIGYVQRVLSALNMVTVTEHRDWTRDIIKESELYLNNVTE